MSIRDKYMDTIYDFIEIESNILKELNNDDIKKEIERSLKIKNLGPIYNIFYTSTHSKWEHHLGIYHLINQLGERIKLLNTNDVRELVFMNFFYCFGYIPMTYCAFEALILYYNKIDSDSKEKIISDYFKNVYLKANEYAENKNLELIKDPKEIFENFNYKILNNWFGAYKFLKYGNHISNLNKNKLVYDMVSRKNKVKDVYFLYAKLDYLQRDLYYTGIMKFGIPLGNLISSKLNKNEILIDDYKNLLESLRILITNQVYRDSKVITLENLIRNKIMNKLESNDLNIDDLLNQDDDFIEKLIDKQKFIMNIEKSNLVISENVNYEDNNFKNADKKIKSKLDLDKYLGIENLEDEKIIVSTDIYKHTYNQIKFVNFNITIKSFDKANAFKLFDIMKKFSEIDIAYA